MINDLTPNEFIGLITGILGLLMIGLMIFLGIILYIGNNYEQRD